MAMRVTENMKFSNALYNLSYLQSAQKTIIEQMSSQKKINRPSDDPTGVGKVFDIRCVQQMNEQYQKNIDGSESWLRTTEAKLSDLTDALVNAQEIAVAQATGTATAATRQIAAANVQQLTEEMFSLANADYMGRYIFAGTRSDEPPLPAERFEDQAADLVTEAGQGGTNGFTGTLGMVIRSIRLAGVVAGDALTIEGSTYTAVANGADPAAGEFNIGATDEETADNLRTAIATVHPGVYTLGGAGTATMGITRTDAAELSAVSTNSRIHFSSYSGSTNKTYALKIITGGSLAGATYAVSQDGGKTWGAEKTDLDTGIVDLGNGMVMRFTAGTFAVDDMFFVRASTPGFYIGDSQELTTDIGQGSPFAYSISGEEVFSDKGAGPVDLFEVMKNLKDALEGNDPNVIGEQIDKLKAAQEQVTRSATTVGARLNRMDVAKNYQNAYDERAAETLSKLEDADITKLVTDLSTTQLALQAAYKATTTITQGMSILSFLE